MATQPPPGFTIDPEPPAGFTVDQEPPNGFTLDSPPSAFTGIPQAAAMPQGMFARNATFAPAPSASPGGPSALGAFGRSIERNALPTAGIAAFGPGAAGGAAIIAPVAAFTGPFAPLVEGAGALTGGTVASLGGGWLVRKAQDKVLDQFPSVKKMLGMDADTIAGDEKAHPYATFAGEVAPQALFLRPGVVGKIPALIGGTIGGASEAGREWYAGQGYDPLKIAGATAAGAIMQKPTRFGRALGVTDPLTLPTKRSAAGDGDLPPARPIDGETVTDPISGQTVPRIDPSTGAEFFAWDTNEQGNRIPQYGMPDPSRAIPGAVSPIAKGRLVVDITAGPSQPSMTPPSPTISRGGETPIPAAPDTTGLASMGGGMASGITDNTYAMLLDKAQLGETTEAGQPSPVLQLAKGVKDAGGTVDADTLRSLGAGLDRVRQSGATGPAYQQAMRDLVQAHVQGEPVTANGSATIASAHELPEGFTLDGVETQPGVAGTGAEEPPPGFTLDEPDLAPRQRPRPLLQRPTPEDIAGAALRISPRDVMPIPANEVGSLDEAMRANPGTIREVRAPEERQALPPYTMNGRTRRNPMDLIGWLRANGGVQDQGGELSAMGIDNTPRDMEFARDEGFLGKLVRPDGLPLDEAARAAWDAGYFPGHADRPSINDFLDTMRATHNGSPARAFHPDDADAIADYRDAQNQRYAVEAAQDAGSPLHHDIGRPIDLADLEANAAPATAYDDLRRAGGVAGNIRIDGLNSPRDIAQALDAVERGFGGFDAARRGNISHGETEALAADLNMSVRDLLRRRSGQALNAEQALAARQILAKSADNLVRLAKSAQGGADADVAKFREALVRHAAIQEQVSGMTAEAGRLLSQFRMTADAGSVSPRALREILEAGGGREKLEDIASKILDLEQKGTPGEVNTFVRKALNPKWWDKLTELYINSLLSGPRTHATNIGGNLLTALWTLPEHGVTAAIGKVTRSEDRMTFTDVGSRAAGMIEGARDGLRLAAKSFRTEAPADGVAKLEQQKYQAISGWKGKVVRIPTRALTAEDEFFKAIAYRGELNALAAREALKRGGGRDAIKSAYDDLRNNPSEAMVEQAKEHALYITFQAPLKGSVGQGAMMMARNPIARIIVPFVRTPANILKFAVERSPFAPALGEFRDSIRAGGVQRDQAMARVAMGSGLAALAVYMAKNGILSGGGPTDRRELEALRNTGWQPYSFRYGDTWYSYQRVDPFARFLSTAADFTEFEKYMTPDERQQFADKLGIAVARNVSTMPLLDPASSFFNAISDPDRFLHRYVNNLAASAVVPQFVAQFNSTQDPYLRETDDLLSTVKARVPGLSEGLPARTNFWGDPIQRGGALGPDLLSPLYASQINHDPVMNEVARLKAGLSKPQRSVGDMKLSPADYSALVASAGQPAKKILGGMFASPLYEASRVFRRLRTVRRSIRYEQDGKQIFA